MAEKASKIDDIKRPDKVAPSATARPIIVTNHPTMASDPMMAPSDGKAAEEAPSEQPMSHTAKTIKPLDASLIADAEKADEPEATVTEAVELEASGSVAKSEEAKAPKEPKSEADEADVKKPEKPAEGTAKKEATPPEESASDSAPAEGTPEVKRDGEAAISAEEAAVAEAKAKREEELEELIVSGKYAVPIDAVQRKRSRINTLLLFFLALLLTAVLADAAADAGIVRPPASVPHTHYFSAK